MWITFSFNRRWRKRRSRRMMNKWLGAKSRFWFHFEFPFYCEMLSIHSWFFHYFLLFDQINKQSHRNWQVAFFDLWWCDGAIFTIFLPYYRPDVCSNLFPEMSIVENQKLISVYLYGMELTIFRVQIEQQNWNAYRIDLGTTEFLLKKNSNKNGWKSFLIPFHFWNQVAL